MLTRTDRPWTNVYGLARSMLALATLLTLLANPAGELFRPLVVDDPGIIDRRAIDGLSLFLLAGDHLGLAKLVAILLLLPVVIGWRPRLTALPHWWISYSFAASAATIDGGDLVAATLSLLLLPVALTDRRLWHWRGIGEGGVAASVAAQTGLLLLRVQVSVIYLFAAVLKLRSETWSNGTALYYWWTHPKFGAWGPFRWLTDLVGPTRWVVPLSWGVLVLELCMAFSLVAPPRLRTRLLPFAVLFHVGIALLHGLPTFALTMIAALVVYLRPAWRPFALPELRRRAAPRLREHLQPSPFAQ
ncbi:MAG TPA: sporulation-delaying protein SdpB family protein [Myxococcaceae bacterium]